MRFGVGTAALFVALWWPSTASAQGDDLGLWAAFLAVGDGSSASVLTRMDAAQRSLLAAGRDLRVDSDSVGLLTSVRAEALQLDLQSLYHRLPEEAGTSRQLRMHGLPVSESHYEWTLYPECEAAGHGVLLGLDARTQMTQVDQSHSKGSGFSVQSDLALGTGPWTHTDVAALFQAALLSLEDAAGQEVGEEEAQPVKAMQPLLSPGASTAMFAAVHRMAPRLVQRVSAVVTVDRIGDWEPDGVLALDLLGRIRPDALAAEGHPHLARYLQRLGDLVVIELSVRDGTGLPLVTLGASTETLGLRLGLSSRGGALVARKGGVPVLERPMYPTDPAMNFTVRTDVEIRAEGMLLKIRDFEVPLSYRSTERAADVGAAVTQEPSLEFTGQTTVTRWVAEALEGALNLEAHGQVVFRAMAQGLDGQGAQMAVQYAGDADGGMVRSSTQVLLVDNALVKMGMRIVGRQLAPSDAVVGEGIAMAQSWVFALDHDYRAARPKLALAGS